MSSRAAFPVRSLAVKASPSHAVERPCCSMSAMKSGSSADGKAPPMVMLADTRSAMIRLLKMMVGGKRGRVQPARARPSRSLRERFVPGIGIRLGGPGRLDLGMGGYGADAAPRGVGGRREAQPFRPQALDPGPPVSTIKMVADDALQGIGLFARIGGGSRLSRHLGDDPRQHFAVRSDDHTTRLNSSH